MNPKIIEKKIKNIRKIYERYSKEISKLRLKQKDLILEYIKEEEEREINKIRQSIKKYANPRNN